MSQQFSHFKTPNPKPHPNTLGWREAGWGPSVSRLQTPSHSLALRDGVGPAGDPRGLPVLFMQRQPLKVQVQLLALWSFDRPHAELAPTGICRVTWGQDAADGGVAHSPSTRGWSQTVEVRGQRGDCRERERSGAGGRMSECFILLRPQPLSERKCAGKRNTIGKRLPPETGPSCVTGDPVPRLEPPCAHRGREGTADLTHWLCPVLGYKMVIKKT